MAWIKRIAKAAETYEDDDNEKKPWGTSGVAFARIKVVLAMLFWELHTIVLV